MLVLSRKQNQSVIFPALGISVEIHRIAGKTVRVGIDAPEHVRILRGELIDGDAAGAIDSADANSATVDAAEAKRQHDFRNRLNQAGLALKLLEKQLVAGRIDEAETSLQMALKTFQQLDDATAQSSSAQSSSAQSASVAASSMMPISTPAPAPNARRALLVEDDPNQRTLLASYLRSCGYDVDTAEDGQAALEYLKDHKPDAVVMDLEMPRLSGDEAVRRIRDDLQYEDVKLFVVSGMKPELTSLHRDDRRIQQWFRKPLQPEDLVAAMDGSLN